MPELKAHLTDSAHRTFLALLMYAVMIFGMLTLGAGEASGEEQRSRMPSASGGVGPDAAFMCL